ncbi:cupin domain-containing protein [Bosea sp. NPDC003192]|jgi:quercetin dioxygenase-like cupin family protein|uniref:cupin domain-containing protein n=1 Tax=Bosea sp. NPDC003192 TaxID=3390551 RepID=UPI003CFCCB87
MPDMTKDNAPNLRRQEDGFAWEGVERLAYKQDGDAPFRNVSRQILFSRSDLAGELRYFEVAAGGHTTLERHGHVHGVMIIRGRGRCLVGSEVSEIGPLDLVTIPGWSWHQFKAAPDEPLGFLCLVDATRDRPALPTAEELATLRASPEIAAFLDG